MCESGYKKKERKALNSSLYSLTHRNTRTIKLVSLRVRLVGLGFFIAIILMICYNHTDINLFRRNNYG